MSNHYDMEMKSTGVDVNQRPREHAETDEFDEGGLSRRGSKLDPGHTAADQRAMDRMGKKQELMRNFRMVSSIGFTVSHVLICPFHGLTLTSFV